MKREPHEDSLKVIVKAHHILPIYQASLKDRIKNFHHKGFRTGHPPKALRMKLSDEVKEDVLPAVAMNVLQQIQHLLDPPPLLNIIHPYERFLTPEFSLSGKDINQRAWFLMVYLSRR